MGNRLSNNDNRSILKYDSQESYAAKIRSDAVIAFLSPTCGLCRSLEPELQKVESHGIAVARINTLDSYTWAPEMLAYDVKTVPCFVYVDKKGDAVGKSALPKSKAQMIAALSVLLQQKSGRNDW